MWRVTIKAIILNSDGPLAPPEGGPYEIYYILRGSSSYPYTNIVCVYEIYARGALKPRRGA